jgi:transposase
VATSARQLLRSRTGPGTVKVGSHQGFYVVLLQRYSKSPSVASSLRKALQVAARPTEGHAVVDRQPYRPYTVRQRLGEELVQTIVAVSSGGKTSPELVASYGISKTAVLKILHEEGLARRKPGLTADQIAEAVALQVHGESYEAIGRRFGVFGSTVWRALNAEPEGDQRVRPKPRQAQRRLSSEQVNLLIRAYEGGINSSELAVQFGVHRRTVIEHLNRHGVAKRGERRKLTDTQLVEAQALYDQGWSTVKIGHHFTVNHNTVWQARKRAGVELRSQAGWKGAPPRLSTDSISEPS